MTSEDSWKQKYLDELEDAERREKLWEGRVNALERMLVRTSLASEGQDIKLDQSLTELRRLLRNSEPDTDELHALQEQIDRRISYLDERRDRTVGEIRTALQKLLGIVSGYPQFRQHKSGLRALEKSIGEPLALRDALPDWLHELCELLHKHAEQSADPGQRSTNGVLGRLLGRKKEVDDPGQENAVGDSLDVGAPVPEVWETASGDQRLRIARRVGELLGQLRKQVVLEPDADERARHLQDDLLRNDDWEQLRDGLNGVADLVIAALTRSQREFEGFLRRLDERLQSLQHHFAEQQSAQSGRQSASEELEKDIREELDAFGNRVDATNDMDELKASVASHLSSVSGAIDLYRQREAEREALLTRQLEAMQEKLALVEAHSEQMSKQLVQERSRALTDLLTELPNREAWEERLQLEYNRWSRYGHPLSLSVLDIDFFKRVNDSYGHKAGDRVLQLVAGALRERLRNTDFIARYGGEEFVVLLPDTTQGDARKVMDEVREHIAGLPFHFQGEPVSVTFSAGVAQFVQDEDVEEAFDRADRLLYDAKKAGRNRVLASDG